MKEEEEVGKRKNEIATRSSMSKASKDENMGSIQLLVH